MIWLVPVFLVAWVIDGGSGYVPPWPELDTTPSYVDCSYTSNHIIGADCVLREVYGYVLTEEAMMVEAAHDLNTPLARYLMHRAAAIIREEIRRVADQAPVPDLVP